MHQKIKCSGHLKNFLNSISTMVHFFMWVQYIFSIKRSSFLLVCISEQDIILHQGQVLHLFKFIHKKRLNNSIQFLQKKYASTIEPTINFHPDIDPKIEVDPIINGEEKYGGLSSIKVFALVTLGVLIAHPICTMLFKKYSRHIHLCHGYIVLIMIMPRTPRIDDWIIFQNVFEFFGMKRFAMIWKPFWM